MIEFYIKDFLFLAVHVRKEKGEAENPDNRVGKNLILLIL